MCWENFCVHLYEERSLLINEQNNGQFNSLYKTCMTSIYSVHACKLSIIFITLY